MGWQLRTSLRRLVATGGLVGLSAVTGLSGAAASAVQAFAAGPTSNYLVVFKASQIPPGQAAKFQSAGGQLVAKYDQIGVALVRSDNVYFLSNVLADSNVDDAASTAGLGYQLPSLQDSTTDTATGPPTRYVFSSAIQADYSDLAIIGVLTSAIATYFYLKLIVAMYMRPSEEGAVSIRIPASLGLVLVVAVALTIQMGVLPSFPLSLAASTLAQ